MSKWYGSLDNRFEENRQFVDTIEVGTGVTEYFWSDRHPYEVVEVKDQKHISIRAMDHESAGECYSNQWILKSNEDAPVEELAKRGNYWYSVVTITPERAKEILDGDDIDARLWACHNGFYLDEIVASGKNKTKYHKRNISIGRAEYYYDYEF